VKAEFITRYTIGVAIPKTELIISFGRLKKELLWSRLNFKYLKLNKNRTKREKNNA
jgi:hypothetical protein